MTDSKPQKPFGLDVGQTSFSMCDLKTPQIRDQDNAAPKPQPPQIFRLDHPRLAPPGMKGIARTVKPGQNFDVNIKVNVLFDQAKISSQPDRSMPKERLQLGNQGKAGREFKPLAGRAPDKGHER